MRTSYKDKVLGQVTRTTYNWRLLALRMLVSCGMGEFLNRVVLAGTGRYLDLAVLELMFGSALNLNH